MEDLNSTMSGDSHPAGQSLADQSRANLKPEFGPNAVRNAQMHRLRMEGWTYAAIGQFFGVSAFSARKGVGRHDHPPMRILGLSVRASNVLRAALDCYGCTTAPALEVIAALSYEDVRGAVSAREIAAMLWERGFEMAGLPSKLRVEFASWKTGILYATPELQQAAERRAEMHSLRGAGWTTDAIAKKFGISAGHVNLTLTFYTPPSLWEEGLSVRARNALHAGMDVHYRAPLLLEMVAALSYDQISGLPCLGKVCAAEIVALLWQYGFEIKGVPTWLSTRISLLPVRKQLGRNPK